MPEQDELFCCIIISSGLKEKHTHTHSHTNVLCDEDTGL